MKKDIVQTDTQIRKHLKVCADGDRDYWSFRDINGNSRNSFFKYPAMMVSHMQGQLIDAIISANPCVKDVYEPFVGSGTVMLETMKRGLDFTGQDINPLAVLLCRTKSGPFYEDALRDRINELLDIIKVDPKSRVEVSFPGLEKWFRNDVAIELSRIVRAIRKERYLWCRRFYWTCLAETVRLTSNARTTTFKLHSRTKDEIKTRIISPIEIFSKILQKNLAQLAIEKSFLTENHTLARGRYVGNIQIRLADSSAE